MIVDAHTRIWEPAEPFGALVAARRDKRSAPPWDRLEASGSAHLRAMEPVAAALVLGFESHTLDASISLDAVAKYVREDPSKRIGLAGIDAAAGSIRRKLDHAAELGLQGVTISPAAQGRHPADSRLMKLYEQCEQRHWPIMVETGALLARQTKMEFDQPHLFDEVAREFPDLKLVIGSMGDPWIEQTLALLAKHPTVFADLSGVIQRPWQLYQTLSSAHQRGVMDQLLFGSGFPFMTPQQAIVAIYSVNTMFHGTGLPSIPREQLRAIVERDALTCLGLTLPALPAGADGQPAVVSASVAREDSVGDVE